MGAIVALLLLLLVRLLAPHAPNRGFDWGNFASGTLGGEGIVDRTQHWDAAHVRILKGAGPNGGNAALLVATDSDTLPDLDHGGVAHVRIHGFRQTSTDPRTRWFGSDRPHEVAEAISIKLPRGYAYNRMEVTTLELHGDNGTGPAPLNVDYQLGGTFELVVRGSDSSTGSGNPQFAQNLFGAATSRQTYGGPFYRREQPFLGGNVAAVPGRWVSFRFWWHDLSADPRKGAFTAWVDVGGQSGWRKIVDVGGISTAYPDVNGDGQAVYPMLSLYYDAGGGGRQAVEYAAGRIEPSLDLLERWQDRRLGLR